MSRSTWRTAVALATVLALPTIVVAEQIGPTHVRDYEGYGWTDSGGISAFGVSGLPSPDGPIGDLTPVDPALLGPADRKDDTIDVGRIDVAIPAGADGFRITAVDDEGFTPNILVRFWWPTLGEVNNSVVCPGSSTLVDIGQQGPHGNPHEVRLYIMPPTADPDDPMFGPAPGPECKGRTMMPTGTVTVQFIS